jgi:hypothetical protein
MAQRTKGRTLCQVQSELKTLKSAEGLPFQQLLDGQRMADALEQAGVTYRERVYTPQTTLFAFLSQVLAGKGGTCQEAVSRILVDRVVNGQSPCSPETSSYCQARQRLPEEVLAQLARQTGQELDRAAPDAWQWKGRHVTIVDGSTAEMADTPENQKEYPQSRTQRPGLGFPVLRLVVLISLAVGTVLECAVGPCRGKKTGEQNLFRQLWSLLQPGDIVLGDCLYDAYRDIALLQARGVDTLFGKKQSRRVDFRCGRALGPDDHVVTWHKPRYDAERFESRAEWEALPDSLPMREVRRTLRRPGFRPRTIIIVTTLLDEDLYSAAELIELFGLRWHCELDLRSIKQVLGMVRLKCKTPAMVQRELWVYLLAYNLVRTRMAQAAAVHDVLPRTLSFTAAQTHLHYFGMAMDAASAHDFARLQAAMLRAIVSHPVGGRPGRQEPRAVKKRRHKYSYLTQPRSKARQRLPA